MGSTKEREANGFDAEAVSVGGLSSSPFLLLVRSARMSTRAFDGETPFLDIIR